MGAGHILVCALAGSMQAALSWDAGSWSDEWETTAHFYNSRVAPGKEGSLRRTEPWPGHCKHHYLTQVAA